MTADDASPRPTRLIATDYDGTLLGEGRKVSDHTREVLSSLPDAGIDFVVITGRPPRFCDNIADEVGIDFTLICANGAVGYDPATREVTQFATIDLDDAHLMVAEISAALPDAAFCAEMGAGWTADRRWGEVTGRNVERDEFGDLPHDIRDRLDPRLHKLLVALPDRDPDAAMEAVAEITGNRVNAMHAGLPFVELMPAGVDKAFGLRRLCADRGVHSHEVMTFGDMPNDIAMIEWAGWGVAVANAHHTVLDAADHVTLSNLDHGVATAIRTHLSPSGPA